MWAAYNLIRTDLAEARLQITPQSHGLTIARPGGPDLCDCLLEKIKQLCIDGSESLHAAQIEIDAGTAQSVLG